MSQENDKKKLLELLSQLNDHTIQINNIVKEINDHSQSIKAPELNLDPDLIQLKITANSMISKIKDYYDKLKMNELRAKEFKANENKTEKTNKTNDTKNKVDNKDLKIYIGFKNPSGGAYTFEAKYGTTIDKLISTYLKTIGKDLYQNDLYFEYNGDNLYVGDKRKIEKIFCNAQEPTILVKKSEYYPTTTATGTNNVTATNDFTGTNNYESATNDFVTTTNDLTDQNNQNLFSNYENNNYNYGY